MIDPQKTMSRDKCDRCKNPIKKGEATTMSMFNLEVICMSCKDKEKNEVGYKDAVEADIREIRKGNYNFPGIGHKKLPH